MAAGGTTSTGIPSSTTTGAEDDGVGAGVGLGPEVGEGEAAGVAEAGRTGAGGDDGGGLTVVAQDATNAATSNTATSGFTVTMKRPEMR